MSVARLEGAVIRAILAAETALCPDCGTPRFGVRYDDAAGAWKVMLFHERTCPVRRSAWSERAADDYIRALLIMGGMTLADYGDVTGEHLAR